MENKQKIPVEKVTKPIQLLAAWLTGLILIDTAFLTAANTLSSPEWVVGLLVIASVGNVPAFLIAIFLLQTKFRPEMQEDVFYSKYLESKTGVIKKPISENQLSNVREELFTANTQTIQLISSLQEEIKKLSINVENGPSKPIQADAIFELEAMIAKVEESSSWNQYKIRINKLLSNYEIIKKVLIKNNVPIHETFGNKDMELIEPPQVLIGSGFDIKHIKKFINSISDQEVKVIAFAIPDGEDDNYHREILIGSYFEQDFGLSLEAALEIINSPNIDIEVFYSAIKS